MRKSVKKSYSKILSGVVKKHPDGFGFLICNDKNHEDIYLSRRQMEGIFSDDEIEVTAFARRGRFYGRINKIIRHTITQVTGPLILISKKRARIKDLDGAWGEDLVFDLADFSSLKEGSWVQVQITSYPGSKQGFQGRLLYVLGDFPSALEDNVKTLRKYNIPYAFPESVLKESEECSDRQSEKSGKRQDLTALPFVTIDSRTAKDFDDAVCVQKKPDGWTLFVSIADVSFFVEEEGALDCEAFLRGNSTYFPGFVSPMLPENLSENLCSLKPKENRFAFTAQIDIDNKGKRTKSLFYESVIYSHARLTYGQAQQVIDGASSIVSDEIAESLKNSAELAEILMNSRFKNGSLNLEIPETEIRVNQRGEPTDILQAERLFSHQLIEELMLACNQSVAEFLSQKKTPSVYRVHDVPQSEDLSKIRLLFESIDSSPFPLQKKTAPLQKQISYWIEKLKNHPKKLIMNQLILRAMPQACYSAFNRGHFGLNFNEYTHFTSPIRRYSDLLVHRILKKELGFLSVKKSFSKKELESKSQNLSQCEQRSVQAERHIHNIKKARFMQKFLGREFTGIIAGVTRFGFFVTLRKYHVDGLIHTDRLGGKWAFNSVQMILKAQPSGYTFNQGDEVLVQVAGCDVEQGLIDFNLIQHNEKPFQKQPRARKKGGNKRNRKNKGYRSKRR